MGPSTTGVGLILAQGAAADPAGAWVFAPPGADGMPSAATVSVQPSFVVPPHGGLVVDELGIAMLAPSTPGGSLALSLFTWAGSLRAPVTQLPYPSGIVDSLFGGDGLFAIMPVSAAGDACAFVALDESGQQTGTLALPYGQSFDTCAAIVETRRQLVIKSSGAGFVGAFLDADTQTLDLLSMASINAPVQPLAQLPLGEVPWAFDVAQDPTTQRTVALWSNAAPFYDPVPTLPLATGGPGLPTVQLSSNANQNAVLAANASTTLVLYADADTSVEHVVILDASGAVAFSVLLDDDATADDPVIPSDVFVTRLDDDFVVAWVRANATDARVFVRRFSCG
jgi:hypothetical protein